MVISFQCRPFCVKLYRNPFSSFGEELC